MYSALYYPILRAKQGEIESLGHLSPRARSRVRPFIDIPRQKTNDNRSLEQYLADTLTSIKQSHGTSSPLFVDLSQFGPEISTSDGRHPVEFVFEIVRQLRLMAIPVTGPELIRGEGPRYLEAVKGIVQIAGMGCGLRIPIAEYRNPDSVLNELEITLREQRLDPVATDLFLDCEALDRLPSEYVTEQQLETTIREALQAIRDIPFRTIVFAASNVPQQVGPEYTAKPLRVDRTDLAIWKNLIEDDVCRRLRFGDYAVIPPFQDDANKPVRAPSRIRLSTEKEHLFYRGPRNQHRTLCQRIFEDQAHVAQSPSWGLAVTKACGRGSGGIGGPADWVARDVNMHIESTVEAVEENMVKNELLSALNLDQPAKEPWLQAELGVE